VATLQNHYTWNFLPNQQEFLSYCTKVLKWKKRAAYAQAVLAALIGGICH
jgi:hypothetical protein